jgi:DNA-binding transcriptional LysR family regulator
MTLRQFTALATVAKHMNIPKAAQALRISQPSLSKHRKLWKKITNQNLLAQLERHPINTNFTDD